MRKNLKILCGLLLYFNFAFADDFNPEVIHDEIDNITEVLDKQYEITNKVRDLYLKDLPYPNVSIEAYPMDKNYFVVVMRNSPCYGFFDKQYNCISVFKDDKAMQQFCFNSEERIYFSDISTKGQFLFITAEHQNKFNMITRTRFTFEQIGDKFYLHKYSKEIENVKEDKVENAYLYYYQPRDDTKKQNLIPLDSVNDTLLESLEKQMLATLKEKYISTLPYEKENITIESYPIQTNKKDFYVLTLTNWDNSSREKSMANKLYSCVDIFDDTKSLQSFCFSDNVSNIENKNDFFTIISVRLKQSLLDNSLNATDTYLTFRFMGDKFYLHQYSREKRHLSNGAKEFKTDETYIYYRQPRDDPKKQNLIPLDSINDTLLESLEKK